jgi:hypothetical protein
LENTIRICVERYLETILYLKNKGVNVGVYAPPCSSIGKQLPIDYADVVTRNKMTIIFNDYLKEKWDFNKRGYGRNLLIRRYDIVQGTARCLIKFLKNNWNPYLDDDYFLFLEGK